MIPLDWNHLQDFLAVARTGRLTAGAQRLGVDHTTLSRRIAALEAALKARLFDRSPQGYALTVHGERLMARAEAMESLMLAAQAEVGEADMRVSGVVRIGAPEGFGSYFLSPRLPALAEQHPELEIQLVAIPGVLSLSKREADVAITLSAPREGRLISRKLTDYSLSLYGAPSYLDARPALKTRADMKDHRFIGYIEELLYAPDVDIRVAFKSSNLIAQLQACVAGAGLAVIPDFVAHGRPYLRRVLADQVGLTREFHLVVHADLKAVARVRAVTEFITEAVRKDRRRFLA
jgi:DNA-binding transcriptional LysR family regulator